MTSIASIAPPCPPTAVLSVENAEPVERISALQDDLHGVSNSSRGAFRNALDGLAWLGRGIRAAFVSIGNALTSCLPHAARETSAQETSAQEMTPIDPATLAKPIMQLFDKSSSNFAGALQDPPAGQPAQPLDRQWFRSVGANLRLLAKPNSGIAEHQQDRVRQLLSVQVMDGMTLGDIDHAFSRRADLTLTAATRFQLRSFFDNVRSVLVDIAKDMSDDVLEDQMRSLYPDQRVNRIVEKLGMKGDIRGEYGELLKDPRYQKPKAADAGARFVNPTRVDTRVQLADGQVYAGANRVELADIEAIICAYPREQDLPAYLTMLMESGAKVVNVLMAKSEMDRNPDFPAYFAMNGIYGDCGVISRDMGRWSSGSLEIDMYDMFIRKGDEIASIRVNHAINWIDFEGVEPKALRGFIELPGNNDPSMVKVNHCRGGLGRAGTCVGAMAVNAGMSTEDAMRSLRAARAPEMVQTNDQVRVLVDIERLRELKAEEAMRSESVSADGGIMTDRGGMEAAESNESFYVNNGFTADNDSLEPAAPNEPIYINAAFTPAK